MTVVARRNGAQNGSLTAIANQKMAQKMQGIDKSQQIQSQIHPQIYIYYNSINLLVGGRGSGKTYNVIREIIKICLLDHNGGYASFVFISDKPNNSTMNELNDLIKDKLKIIVIDYEHAFDVLDEIIEGKTAYHQVVRKDLEGKSLKSLRRKFSHAV
jgi:predicted AAA+ superfamily ATPase